MAPPKRPWFRCYVETFADPNLRALSVSQRWLWLAVLGMARESPVAGALLDKGGLPLSNAYIAAYASLKPAEVKVALRRFHELKMLTLDHAGALVVTAWDKRQFESDDVTTRVAKHRASNGDETPDPTLHPPANGTFPPSEGPRDTEVVPKSSSSSTSVRGAEDDEPERNPKVKVEAAATVLANRDLHRRQTDRGPVRDVKAWLRAAWARRATEASAWLDEHDWPTMTIDQLVDVLDPPAAPPPHPLDDAQRAQRRLAEEGQAQARAVADYEPSPEEREEARRIIEEAKSRGAA